MQNEEMDYQEIVAKMLEHQRRMFPELEEMKKQEKLPHAMVEAMGNMQRWRDVVDGDAGLEDAVSMDAPERFSHELLECRPIFDEHMQREADEYAALVGDLKKVFDNPLE